MKRGRSRRWRLVVIVSTVLIFLIAVLLLGRLNQISPQEAQKRCGAFTTEFKAQVAAVEGYKIVQFKPNCRGSRQDEANNTDYFFSASALVMKLPNGSDSVSIQSDAKEFSTRLGQHAFVVTTENARPIANQPEQLCVSTTEYLNNNGSVISQGGPTRNNYRVITAKEFSQGYKGYCG